MRVQLLAAMACRAGGSDVYTEALAIGLSDRGHSVEVICHAASPVVRERCTANVADLPAYDNLPLVWRFAPYLRWRFWQRYVASADLSTPDIIICSRAHSSAALSRRFPNVPLAYLPHSRIEPVEIDQMLPPSASRIQRTLACSISNSCERWSLLNSTTTVRFTEGNVEDLRRHYQLPDDVRFDIIPAGIMGPTSLRSREFEAPLKLLSVCRLVEIKNLRFLLESLARLTGLPWELDIVGEGPEREGLESLAVELGMQHRVRFHGHQDDTAPYYRDADLHLFPSRLESLGLVVLEAMSHGLPTLAIAADGSRYRNANHEILTPDVDGLLAADEDEFCRLLQSCIECPQQLVHLSTAARRTYVERHQWSVVLDRWEDLLYQLAPATDSRHSPPTPPLQTPLPTPAALAPF